MTKKSNSNDESLDYKSIAYLLEREAQELAEADEPAEMLRSILMTIAEAADVRHRGTAVDAHGRIYFGRDLSGEDGIALFLPDEAGESDAE